MGEDTCPNHFGMHNKEQRACDILRKVVPNYILNHIRAVVVPYTEDEKRWRYNKIGHDWHINSQLNKILPNAHAHLISGE